MMQRKENIVPELLKRISSKNKGVIEFCLKVMILSIQQNNINLAEVNLKMFFKYTHDLLGH
jgi:hypothetical protein